MYTLLWTFAIKSNNIYCRASISLQDTDEIIIQFDMAWGLAHSHPYQIHNSRGVTNLFPYTPKNNNYQWPYFNIFQVELQLPVVHSLVFTPVAGLAGQVVVDQSWLDPSKTTGRVRLGLWTSTKKSSKKSVLEKDSLFRKFLVWWLKWADRFECGNMTSCSRQSQSSMVCI